MMILVMLMISIMLKAQSEIWISGNVYTEVEGKQVMIPFATICVYDLTDTDKMEYFSVSGMQGNYYLKPYNYKKQYHYVVSAFGYKTKEFNLKEIPEYMDGKPFSGNATINVKMEKCTDALTPMIKKIVYPLAGLKKKSNAKYVVDALEMLPEIKKDGNDWIDSSTGESVCFFLNGTYVTPDIYTQLKVIPLDMIVELEYYKLPEGGNYGAVVNIHLSVGQTCKAPDYTLKENELIF
nr:hypothetical protein [Prevotella sp.]